MQSDALAYLHRLFESDLDADDYYQRFPVYEYQGEVGLKPWHPGLSEVWAFKAECPETFPNAATWAEAWEHVSRLYAHYVRARGR